MDLKGEITKFLEALIDKHPETLDAIESVRMNRLGLSSANSYLCPHPPNLAQARSFLFLVIFFACILHENCEESCTSIEAKF